MGISNIRINNGSVYDIDLDENRGYTVKSIVSSIVAGSDLYADSLRVSGIRSISDLYIGGNDVPEKNRIKIADINALDSKVTGLRVGSITCSTAYISGTAYVSAINSEDAPLVVRGTIKADGNIHIEGKNSLYLYNGSVVVDNIFIDAPKIAKLDNLLDIGVGSIAVTHINDEGTYAVHTSKNGQDIISLIPIVFNDKEYSMVYPRGWKSESENIITGFRAKVFEVGAHKFNESITTPILRISSVDTSAGYIAQLRTVACDTISIIGTLVKDNPKGSTPSIYYTNSNSKEGVNTMAAALNDIYERLVALENK